MARPEVASSPLIVLDTLVVVSALLGGETGPSNRVVQAVETGEARLAVSDEFLRELARVTAYPDVVNRIGDPARALRTGLDLGLMGELHRPRRYDWPTIPDAGDWWILDLAYEAGADYIVSRDGHLNEAPSLGFEVVTPSGLLEIL